MNPHHEPISLFYCYAHEDEVLRDELEKHLRLLQHQGLITAWHDRQILPGADWAQSIEHHLNKCSIILLLISPDFLASEHCYNIEMQQALERHHRGEARVIPIILRPVDWQQSPFADLQCLPRDGKPVTEWGNQDAAFRNITENLRRTIEQQRGSAHPLSYRNYLHWLIERTYYLDPRGTFQTQRQVQVRMEEIYISLAAQRDETPGKADRLLLEEELAHLEVQLAASHTAAEEIEDRREQVLARFETTNNTNKTNEIQGLANVVHHHDRVVILGDPGSGKTTLLRYLALKHAQALWQGQQDVGKDLGEAYFPILIRIAEYAEEGIWIKQSLSDFLIVYHSMHECPKQGLANLLQSELERGCCLILLDGLDEIVSADERRGVVQRIEDFVRSYSNKANRFVITSRIAGYRSTPLGTPFSHYIVREMDEEQIHTFLEHWCQAVENAQTPAISLQERKRVAKREIDSIMRVVRTSSGVRRLAANPLLLRVLALIHRTGAQLPQKRIELYKLAADTLARTWRTAQGVRESVLVADEYLTPMLSRLAYWLHTQKPTGIATEREVYITLGEEWARLNDLPWDEDDPDPRIKEEIRKFLVAVREHTGLFVERAPKRYGFMHLTFEEYYVARYLIARSRSRARLIRKHLHDPRWEEAILLALGFVGLESPEEASALVETAILAKGEEAEEFGFAPSQYEDLLGRDYLLALRCLGDSIPIQAKTQRRLTERLASELEGQTKLARFPYYRRMLKEKLRFLEGSKITPTLLAHLSSNINNSSSDHSYRAINIFTQWGEVPSEAITILLQALSHDNPRVREQAAESLGELKRTSPEILSALLQSVHDPDSMVRMDVIRSLGLQKHLIPEVMTALLEALHDKSKAVRLWAAFALEWQKQTSPEVISALVRVLSDNDQNVRQKAAYSLGMLGKTSSDVETALRQLLHDEEHWVRSHAAVALGQLGHISIDVISTLLCVPDDEQLWIFAAAENVLEEIDLASSGIVAVLLEALKDDSTHKRQEAAQKLGRLGKAMPTVHTALIEALQDNAPDIRQAAAQSLGRLGEAAPEITTALIQALYDENLSVRQAATMSLGRLGETDPKVINALIEMLRTHELQERVTAAQSLSMLGQVSTRVCNILLGAVNQIEDTKQCSLSAYWLGRGGQSDEQTVQQLLQGLRNPKYKVRDACLRALVQLGRRFPNTQLTIVRELIRAAQDSKFDGQDDIGRSGGDYAYEGLWLLIIGEKV